MSAALALALVLVAALAWLAGTFLGSHAGRRRA